MAEVTQPEFPPDYYESAPGVHCLLIEHFGIPNQILPVQREAPRLCGNKVSAIVEAMRRIPPSHRRRALDLGCAVGGSVFKLREYFEKAVGVDQSPMLLTRARALRDTGEASVTWKQEGFPPRTCAVHLPPGAVTDGIDFLEADIWNLPADLGSFDLVVIEKVLECLPDPQRFMALVPKLVAPGGYFLHVSSYRWSNHFTAPEKHLGTPAQVPGQIAGMLGPEFTLDHRFNVPFLLEHDTTWFSYGVAEATLWKRNQPRSS